MQLLILCFMCQHSIFTCMYPIFHKLHKYTLNWNTVDQISKTIIKMELDHVQTYCFPNIVLISEKLPFIINVLCLLIK